LSDLVNDKRHYDEAKKQKTGEQGSLLGHESPEVRRYC
jgi:hypothetical protein